MAIATKTALWKLAATKLGMAPSVHVLDANSPSTALELTFDQLYDNVRIAQLRSGKFDFANRTQTLRLAPTVDFSGNTNYWNDRWPYVYARPIEMLQFLHFADEPPGIGFASDYEMIPLPIAYKLINATVAVAYVISSLTSADWLPNYMWRNWARGVFIDRDNVKHTVTDKADGPLVSTFDWKDLDTGVALPGHVSQSYAGGMTWSLDYQPGVVSGAYDLVGAVAIAIEVAYGSPYSAQNSQIWSEHIGTSKSDAVGRYVIDVSDVSMMPVEFQNSVATQMAYEASMVHAKSPRVIQKLEIDAARAFSLAVSSLSSDDWSFEGGGPSRATRARY
ncbi:MAG: hypothetical protein ACKVOG_12835 [Rhodoglobus sp.]